MYRGARGDALFQGDHPHPHPMHTPINVSQLAVSGELKSAEFAPDIYDKGHATWPNVNKHEVVRGGG